MVDVPTDFGVLLNAGPPIGRIESNKLNSFRKRQATATECMQNGINQIGKLAAEAQGLKRPVTSFARFSDSSDDQALYLLWEPAQSVEGGHSSTIFGYLKIVRDRRLYLADDDGRQYVTTPICVLDFFVHKSVQQQGKGVQLFNAMLKAEGDLEARRCAFDKPSVQLLQFLARHFGLERPIWQSTSFVVFHSFFEGMEPEKVSNAEDRLRPMTALERHRRTVNEQYNGQQPMSSRLSPLPAAQRDHAAALIHQQSAASGERTPAPPDTPQGRKVQRDYGHQRIW
uniref:Alpha-tubulin N-acetyltransferase n=1 Tax=Globodera rostochiensis TaxID=31243 RepID=A0A914GZ11_GLORO